jgi:hypothetical protein
MDNIEQLVLDAAKAEGKRPSYENLPASGELISRTRVDDATGEKSIEYFGRESFIKELSRPSQRVVRLLNPRTGEILQGPP